MSRYRESFTLIKRGRVWYYRFYDEGGRRLCKSSGQTSKTLAREYCLNLIKAGKLTGDMDITFGSYVELKKFFIWGKCEYIEAKLARSPKNKPSFRKATAEKYRSDLENVILPEFKGKMLSKINAATIEKATTKWLSLWGNKTVKNRVSILKVILSEAFKEGLIQENPFDRVRPISIDRHARGILTLNEASTLFSQESFVKVWKSHRIYYACNLLAAMTGMRKSEIRGLLQEHYHGNYIEVFHSFTTKNQLQNTKTNKDRYVPVPPVLKTVLDQFVRPGKKYLISFDDYGLTAISENRMNMALTAALEGIGIGMAEKKARSIGFHSWRHFFNTYLRGQNITDAKIQAVTGHSTDQMTDNYTHFQPEHYTEISTAQAELIGQLKIAGDL